jgi:hypothetical protein
VATIQGPRPEEVADLIIYDIIHVNVTFFNRDQEFFYAETFVICNGELSVDGADDFEGDPKLSVRAQILTPCVFAFLHVLSAALFMALSKAN